MQLENIGYCKKFPAMTVRMASMKYIFEKFMAPRTVEIGTQVGSYQKSLAGLAIAMNQASPMN